MTTNQSMVLKISRAWFYMEHILYALMLQLFSYVFTYRSMTQFLMTIQSSIIQTKNALHHFPVVEA